VTGRLSGRVVATTRDDAENDPLVARLRAEGAEVVRWPTITFGPPSDPVRLNRALEELATGRYRWLVCTSARGAEAVGPAARYPGTVRVGAVGRATANALEQAGWRVDVVGGEDAAALVAALHGVDALGGARILFPAASRAGKVLEEGLGAAGARVDRVEAYATLLVPPDAAKVRTDLVRGVDVVTFASPSAVGSLAEGLGPEWPAALDGVPVVAIGPSTERALVEAGLASSLITTARSPGFDTLVDACVAATQKI